MVASTFIYKEDEKFNVVNHLDGNKLNNYYKNLEWTSPKGNTRYDILIGLQTNSGTNAPRSVYTEDVIREICKKLESGMDCYEIYTYFTNDRIITDKAFLCPYFFNKKWKKT